MMINLRYWAGECVYGLLVVTGGGGGRGELMFRPAASYPEVDGDNPHVLETRVYYL